MSGNLLAIINETTGEVIRAVTAEDLLASAGLYDIEGADDVDLASFMDGADHLLSIAREAKGRVSDELVGRADKRGKWTSHVGEFTVTVKGGSPTAGTTSYDGMVLLEKLAVLVEEDVIAREALEAAVEVVTPEPFLKVKQAGVKALLSLGGRAAEVVLAAQVPVEPPKRSVKVSRK